MRMNDYPHARVEEVDGQLVLIDPAAEGVIAAVESYNRNQRHMAVGDRVMAQAERVQHFVNRAKERGDMAKDVCIVIISAIDPIGEDLAKHLVPECDWQAIIDRGEIPYARGLAGAEGMLALVELHNPAQAGLMKRMMEDDVLAVVAVDLGMVIVMAASTVTRGLNDE